MTYANWTLWILAAGVSLFGVTLAISIYHNAQRRPKRLVISRSIRWCLWIVIPVCLVGCCVIAVWCGEADPDPNKQWSDKVTVENYYEVDDKTIEKIIEVATAKGYLDERNARLTIECNDLREKLTAALQRATVLNSQGRNEQACAAIENARESGDVSSLLSLLIQDRALHRRTSELGIENLVERKAY